MSDLFGLRGWPLAAAGYPSTLLASYTEKNRLAHSEPGVWVGGQIVSSSSKRDARTKSKTRFLRGQCQPLAAEQGTWSLVKLRIEREIKLDRVKRLFCRCVV